MSQLRRNMCSHDKTKQIEKLFDVACTLTDVMAYVPMEESTSETGPRDYLQRFVDLISSLRGGQSRHLPLLLSKINEVLPHHAHGFTHAMPLPMSRTSSAPISRLNQLYETTTGPSVSHEASPYASPSQPGLPLRHGSSASTHSSIRSHTNHYPEVPPPLSAYSSFGAAIGQHDSVISSNTQMQGLYQTHGPHEPGRGYNG